jgi:hypothetical protein
VETVAVEASTVAPIGGPDIQRHGGSNPPDALTRQATRRTIALAQLLPHALFSGRTLLQKGGTYCRSFSSNGRPCV